MELHVLVLDDDPRQEYVLRSVLEPVAGTLEFFRDVPSARAAAARQLYDVAVVDLHLQGRDGTGTDFATTLRDADPSLNVLLFTGDVEFCVEEPSGREGAPPRLLKGCRGSEIVAAIRASARETWRMRALVRESMVSVAAAPAATPAHATVEISCTMLEWYRGLYARIANDLTAAGLASAALHTLLLDSAMDPQRLERLRPLAASSAMALERIAGLVQDLPIEGGGVDGTEPYASLKAELDAMVRAVAQHPRLSRRHPLTVTEDAGVILPIAQPELCAGVEGIAGFLLDHCDGEAEIRISCTFDDPPTIQAHLRNERPLVVVNRRNLDAGLVVRVRFECFPSHLSIQAIERALALPPNEGALHATARLIAVTRGGLIFSRSSPTATAMELILPTTT